MGDNLVLVDHLGGVFESLVYVITSQIRVGCEDSLNGVASNNHPEDVADHDPGAAYYGFSGTDFGVHLDAAHASSLIEIH
jgi:hypothetical protein